jgi:hypothetical protein
VVCELAEPGRPEASAEASAEESGVGSAIDLSFLISDLRLIVSAWNKFSESNWGHFSGFQVSSQATGNIRCGLG